MDADFSHTIPVGGRVAFSCSDPAKVFSHNFFINPTIEVVCKRNGVVSVPNEWPICVYRKLIFLNKKQ